MNCCSYRSQVQMIFQDPFSSLNPIHSVEYHLQRPLHIHRQSAGRSTRAQVLELLNRVALDPPEEYIGKYPHQLSGGQRQRVAIARALAVEPRVILADEPISMLDVSIRIGILNLMAKLRDEDNIAFLYVTHDLASARYFADETMVMYAGHVVESGGSEELISNPQHPYTQLLLSAVPDPARGLRTQEIKVKGEVRFSARQGRAVHLLLAARSSWRSAARRCRRSQRFRIRAGCAAISTAKAQAKIPSLPKQQSVQLSGSFGMDY